MQRTSPLYVFGMALASTAANDTKFPISKVQAAYDAWRTAAEAHEQREDALLAAYNANHQGPRNERILAYESYVAERRALYDAARAPGGNRTESIRRMLALPLPDIVKGVGVVGTDAIYTRYA